MRIERKSLYSLASKKRGFAASFLFGFLAGIRSAVRQQADAFFVPILIRCASNTVSRRLLDDIPCNINNEKTNEEVIRGNYIWRRMWCR